MVLDAYTYIFAIGTCFALLEAFNNGASMPLLAASLAACQLAPMLTVASVQTMLPMPGPPVSRRGPSATDRPWSSASSSS